MKNKPLPPLNPSTKEPLRPEDLYPIFAKELCHQELDQENAWIEIPETVREYYKYWRSTPLVRAYGLEKALGTPAHIYFKNESVSPIGSHKLNSAIAQAYYCKEEGVSNITTETGCLFARTEGIIPAPESCHAIAAAVREAKECIATGEEKVILFNLSGHGLIDMASYDQYFAGNLINYDLPDAALAESLSQIQPLAPLQD